MPRVLPFVIYLALAVYAVVDCIQTEESRIRGLPKMAWMLVILFFPLVGSIAWFLAGRPRRPPRRPGPQLPPAPRGPDDDPDYLRKL